MTARPELVPWRPSDKPVFLPESLVPPQMEETATAAGRAERRIEMNTNIRNIRVLFSG